MAGRGKIDDEGRQAHPRVFMLSSEGDWKPAIDPIHYDKKIAGAGLGKSFAVELAQSDARTCIGLIPAACGGSPISCWEPGAYHDQTDSHPYDDAIQRTRRAMQDGVLKGILWHQGEADCNPESAPKYKEKLRRLITRFRRDLHAPSVPFVIGQLGQFPKRPWDSAFERLVDDAQISLAKEMRHVGFVPSEGLGAKQDNVHFNSKSLRELGHRYADVYQEISTSPRILTDEDRMQWWREARFGMFVHWGLYSGLAGEWDGKSLGATGNMEWAQHRAKVETDRYAAQAIPLFKPKAAFADEWAKLAKQAGCKYLVFTTKHHDGFALHDSKVSEFDAGSVLQRDLVEEIVTACRAQGLKIGFYHSVIDWHHDDFAYSDSTTIPHPLRGQPYPNGKRDHDRYVRYLHAQVVELVSNYGAVDIMWWDYSVPDFEGEKAWEAFKLIDLVKRHQPGVVMNNRLFRRPAAGHSGTAQISTQARIDPKYGDFMTPEQHVPDTGITGVDWETCMTMNTTWGYSKYDDNWKPTETLLRTLIDVASKGGNLLLNVGPMPDGTIPPESVKSMQQIGRWLDVNGEAIYGTSASPVDAPDWGRITCKPKEDVVYLHVFDWPKNRQLRVPKLPGRVQWVQLLGGGQEEVRFGYDGDVLVVKRSEASTETLPSVLRLRLRHGS